MCFLLFAHFVNARGCALYSLILVFIFEMTTHGVYVHYPQGIGAHSRSAAHISHPFRRRQYRNYTFQKTRNAPRRAQIREAVYIRVHNFPKSLLRETHSSIFYAPSCLRRRRRARCV